MSTNSPIMRYVYQAGSWPSTLKFIINTTNVIVRKNENDTIVLV